MPATGGPFVIVEQAPAFVRDLLERAIGQRQHVQLAKLVGETEPGSVRRPPQGEQHALQPLGELPGGGLSRLIDDPHLIFARPIGNEGNLRAIGAPLRQAIVSVARAGEIANHTLFDGCGEDVTAGDEQGPLSLGTQTRALDELVDGNVPGTPREAIVGNLDRDPGLDPGGGVERGEFAQQFIDNQAAIVGTGPPHVGVGGVGQLPGFIGRQVGDKQIERARPVGDKVDLVADPHGVTLGSHVMGDGAEVERREIGDIEILSPTPLVSLPRAEVAEQRRVDQLLPVGREIARPGGGEGEFFRKSPGHRHRVQRGLDLSALGIAQRAEQDAGPVGAPAIDLVVVPTPGLQRSAGRVEGQLPGFTPPGWHDVDLFVSVVLASEGDPLAVGREFREEFEARVGCQPGGDPASRRGNPDIARMTEGEFVFVDVGVPEQQCLGRGRLARREQAGQQTQPQPD